MTPSPETVAAYVDGELSPEARVAFEAQMASDPALAAEVARQRALANRLAAAYDPVLTQPVPLALALAAQAANDRRGPQIGARGWAAMAACLAVGAAVGLAVRPAEGPLASRHGALIAQGGLSAALTTQLASDAGPVRVGLTFRTAEGGYCRTFEMAADRLAGVACRDGGRWTARAVSAWTPPAASAYRTAGAETPPAVLAAVDSLIAGEALDARAERAARDSGWKP
ncbi:anti-sigma factor [Phenylobacterium sp.]|uniref:anti-sigma factor family protein n=1 Tax=Phenylobacterium sp. TaxID=1871053 RepID=UPI002C0DC746|nr:anti-sigma factor [Phenylobacterium sp.]HLZ77582.1 anti-sigma factor [Phenylobacterium sp.]